MLIHLLIMLLENRSGKKKPAHGPTRTVQGDKVVIQCPHCAQLGLAEEIFIQQKSGSQWIPLVQLYECHNCRRRTETRLFQNDGSGVLHPRVMQASSP